MVHAGQDDLGQGGDAGSRSAGNAGKRIDCCLINGVGKRFGPRLYSAPDSRVNNSASKMVILPTALLVFSVQFVFLYAFL